MGKKIMKKRIKETEEENVKVLYVYVFCFVLLSVVVVQKVIMKREFAEE